MERNLKKHKFDQEKNNLDAFGKSVLNLVQSKIALNTGRSSKASINFYNDKETNFCQNEKGENCLKADMFLKQGIKDCNEIMRNQTMIEKCLENDHKIETLSVHSNNKKDDDVKGKLGFGTTDISRKRQDASLLLCKEQTLHQTADGKTIDLTTRRDEEKEEKNSAGDMNKTDSSYKHDVKVTGLLNSDPTTICQIGKGVRPQLGKDVRGTRQQVTLVTKGMTFDRARQRHDLSGKEKGSKSQNIDLHRSAIKGKFIEIDPKKETSVVHSSNTKEVKDFGMLYLEPKSVARYAQVAIPQTYMDAGDTPQRMAYSLERLREVLSGKTSEAPCFDKGLNKEQSVNLLVLANRYLSEHLKNVHVLSVLQELYTSPPDKRPFYELWRLSTFARCEDLEVSVIRLSQSGFYYDESADNIICFSCRLSKRKWSLREKMIDVRHLQLSNQCKQVLRSDERNVPLIHEQAHRRGSSDPASRHTNPQDSSAGQTSRTSLPFAGQHGSEDSQTEVGFPYEASERTAVTAEMQPPQVGVYECTTGNNQQKPAGQINSADRNGAQACELETDSDQLAWHPVQEAQDPSVSLSISSQNFPSSTVGHRTPESSADRDPSSENVECGAPGSADLRTREEVDTAAGLDMSLAVCPEYRSQSDRDASFSDWPAGDLPLPNDLASAGFYYMGTGDSVRCFYCGVNLKNWQSANNPWATHVCFRFSCGFVIAVKGEEFVQQVLSVGNVSSEGTSGSNSSQRLLVPSTSSSSAQPAGDTRRQAPRPAQRTCQGTPVPADLAPPRSEPAPAAGWQTQRDALTLQRDSPVGLSSSHNATVVVADSDDLEEHVEQLAETNRQLRQQRMCRVCQWREVDVIFLPCGHLCTCSACASGVTLCCLCRERVLGTARIVLE